MPPRQISFLPHPALRRLEEASTNPDSTIFDRPAESHRPWDADDALVFPPPETYLLDPQQGRLRR